MPTNKTDYSDLEYTTLERWISYYYQIKETISIVRKKNKGGARDIEILEIGTGNRTVFNYIKENVSSKIISLDVDARLKPTVVGDVRHIPFKDSSFDIVLLFQVAEHIPFKDVPLAFSEIRRILKNDGYLICSLPHESLYCTIAFKFPTLSLKALFTSLFHLPVTHKFDGQHYWEIGKKTNNIFISPKRIKRLFTKAGLRVVKEFRNPFFPYHHFFVCKTIRSNSKR